MTKQTSATQNLRWSLIFDLFIVISPTRNTGHFGHGWSLPSSSSLSSSIIHSSSSLSTTTESSTRNIIIYRLNAWNWSGSRKKWRRKHAQCEWEKRSYRGRFESIENGNIKTNYATRYIYSPWHTSMTTSEWLIYMHSILFITLEPKAVINYWPCLSYISQ